MSKATFFFSIDIEHEYTKAIQGKTELENLRNNTFP